MEINYVLVNVPIAHVAPGAEVAVGVIGQGGGEVRGRFAASPELYELVRPMLRATRFRYLQEIFDRMLKGRTLTTTKWEGDEQIDPSDDRYLGLLAERWSDGHLVFAAPQKTEADSLDEALGRLFMDRVLNQQIETLQGAKELVLSP
jgi:hypothetical protein